MWAIREVRLVGLSVKWGFKREKIIETGKGI